MEFIDSCCVSDLLINVWNRVARLEKDLLQDTQIEAENKGKFTKTDDK